MYLLGILLSLQSTVVAAIDDERLDVTRYLVTLLQTLYRIIPCVHGYKSLVEIKEVDTRMLLLQLMRLDKEFVNYWTLEVLSVLCRCPLIPRCTQQEFVNKHTLLSDGMLRCLIEQMSWSKTDEQGLGNEMNGENNENNEDEELPDVDRDTIHMTSGTGTYNGRHY